MSSASTHSLKAKQRGSGRGVATSRGGESSRNTGNSSNNPQNSLSKAVTPNIRQQTSREPTAGLRATPTRCGGQTSSVDGAVSRSQSVGSYSDSASQQAELFRRLADLTLQVDTLSSENGRLRTENDDLHVQLNTEKQRADRYRRERDDAEATADRYQRQCRDLSKELDAQSPQARNSARSPSPATFPPLSPIRPLATRLQSPDAHAGQKRSRSPRSKPSLSARISKQPDAETKAENKRRHDDNATLGKMRKAFIANQEVLKAAKVEPEYRSWDDYKEAFDVEEGWEDDTDDDEPVAKRRKLVDFPFPGFPYLQTKVQVNSAHNNACNGNQTASDLYRKTLAQANEWKSGGFELPEGLDHILKKDEDLAQYEPWRIDEAKQSKNKRKRNKHKSASANDNAAPGPSTDSTETGTTIMAQWRANDSDETVAIWGLAHPKAFTDSFPAVRSVNGCTSLIDIWSRRLLLKLRPNRSMGPTPCSAARQLFTLPFVKLLATPGLYADLVIQHQLIIADEFIPQFFNDTVLNIDVAGVTKFLARVGFALELANEAQPYYRRFLRYQAQLDHVHNQAWATALQESYRPGRRVPNPRPHRQLWHPTHPLGKNNSSQSAEHYAANVIYDSDKEDAELDFVAHAAASTTGPSTSSAPPSSSETMVVDGDERGEPTHGNNSGDDTPMTDVAATGI